MKNIYGIYFICCINNYLEVVEEQLSILNEGLLQNTKKIIIFITNYTHTSIELDNIISKYNIDNAKFILVTSSENVYEKFAINNYKKYIVDNDYYLYYFHTKGLKNKEDPLMNVF
jgi:hypothetical protein